MVYKNDYKVFLKLPSFLVHGITLDAKLLKFHQHLSITPLGLTSCLLYSTQEVDLELPKRGLSTVVYLCRIRFGM